MATAVAGARARALRIHRVHGEHVKSSPRVSERNAAKGRLIFRGQLEHMVVITDMWCLGSTFRNIAERQIRCDRLASPRQAQPGEIPVGRDRVNSTVYRMPAGQGPGFRVVCSKCRKTEVLHHPAKAHERLSLDFVVLVDGVIHPGPIEHREAEAIAYRHNCELHPERPHLVTERRFAPSQKAARAEAERAALTQADELRAAGRTFRETAAALNVH